MPLVPRVGLSAHTTRGLSHEGRYPLQSLTHFEHDFKDLKDAQDAVLRNNKKSTGLCGVSGAASGENKTEHARGTCDKGLKDLRLPVNEAPG